MVTTACSETPEASLATLFLDLFESNVTLLHALERRPEIQAVALDVPAVSVSRREFTDAVARAVVRRGIVDSVLEALAAERPRRVDNIREISESLTALRVVPSSTHSAPKRRRARFAGISTVVGGLLLAVVWPDPVAVVADRPAELPPVHRRAVAAAADDESADDRMCLTDPPSEPPLCHGIALERPPPEHAPSIAPAPRRAAKRRKPGSSTVPTISVTVVSGKTGEVWPVELPVYKTAAMAAREIYKTKHLAGSPAAVYVEGEDITLCNHETRVCFDDVPVIDVFQENDVLQIHRAQKDDGFQHRRAVKR